MTQNAETLTAMISEDITARYKPNKKSLLTNKKPMLRVRNPRKSKKNLPNKILSLTPKKTKETKRKTTKRTETKRKTKKVALVTSPLIT